MATITSDTYLDGGVARTAGEAWTLNGGLLTVRTDTRWHANAPASMTGALGSMTISPTLGGGVLFDGRAVRWLPYNTGSGNVPAIGTSVTQGGVTGTLLGVYDSLTTAPTAVGVAMPADGFIKFREVTGGPFAAGALTGIGASATGPDVTGWIEIVADQATAMTTSRVGQGFKTRGDWFYLDNATGSVGQVLQVPTNGGGAQTWCPGVWVEDTPGSDIYSFWPALDGTDATNGWSQLNIGGPLGGTDLRQRFVKALTNGQMQFGEAFTQASTYAVTTQASTYTWAANFVTVTFTAHGYSVGEQVYLDFTSGGGTPDGVYTIFDVPTANTYRIALTGSGASGNVTTCGRVTVTFTAHGQTLGKTVYLDATSGGLTDGVYEIRGTVAANTYQVAAAVSPATAAGNATMSLTVGHVPASGCKTRIPNVIMRQCVSGTRATNAKPHATVATRPEFNTAGAGVIDFEYAYSDWYMLFLQAYAVTMRHCSFWTILNLQEIATAFIIEDVGVGQVQALDSPTLAVTSCLAGGTIDRFVGQRGNVPSTNDHNGSLVQCNGLTITNSVFGIVGYPRSSGFAIVVSSCRNIIIQDCTNLNIGISIISSFDVDIIDYSYSDRFIGVTNTTALSAISVGTKCADILVDGVIFGARGVPIDRVHPYSYLVSLTSVERVRVRNVGTPGAPVSSATNGVNAPAGLLIVAGANLELKFQNIHYGIQRGAAQALLNVDKNVTFENCSNGPLNNGLFTTFIMAALNARARGYRSQGSAISVAANASVYGTHFMDVFQTDTQGYVKLTLNEPTIETSGLVTQAGTPEFTSVPSLVMSNLADEVVAEMDYFAQGHTGFDGAADRAFLPVFTGLAAVSGSVNYTWVANLVTVTFAAHGYKTGDYIWINPTTGGLSSGKTYAGIYQITVTDATTFTFAQTGSGAAGAMTVWRTMLAEYQIDINDGGGYNGSWRNLIRPMYGVQITNASPTVTMNSTAGLAVGDYVRSSTIADIPSGAQIQSVDSATQITLDANAAATNGTRILYFSQLPNESVVAADGFKMKWRITAPTPHSLNSITYIHAFTTSTLVAQQAIAYPLDLVPLTISGLKNPSEVRLYNAGTTTEIGGQETITSGTFATTIDAGSYPSVDISVLSLGYQNTRLLAVDMTSGDVAIPVQQVIDRQYANS